MIKTAIGRFNVSTRFAFAALLGIALAAGCSDDSGPTGPAATILPETIHGNVSRSSPVCAGENLYGTVVQYPCERFTIVAPSRGTLVARLTWAGQNHLLTIGAGNRPEFVGWSVNACTPSTCEARIPVAAKGSATLAVALVPSGNGIASQAFDVNVSLE